MADLSWGPTPSGSPLDLALDVAEVLGAVLVWPQRLSDSELDAMRRGGDLPDGFQFAYAREERDA